jgi:hypothetical protein
VVSRELTELRATLLALTTSLTLRLGGPGVTDAAA